VTCEALLFLGSISGLWTIRLGSGLEGLIEVNQAPEKCSAIFRSVAETYTYVLADNRLALNAGWDEDLLKQELADLTAESFDLDVIGFDAELVAGLLAAEPSGGLTDEDEIPEPPKKPATRRGDLWLPGNHWLLCGDSTNPEDVTRLMDGKRAALFATDPPYLLD